MRRKVLRAAAGGAGGLLAVVAVAGPAAAATRDFGPRSCSSPYPYVQTSTFSNGTTVHVQIGATTKTKSFGNGNNILHRYYTSGYTSVSASSATTDGSFQSSGNGVSCQN